MVNGELIGAKVKVSLELKSGTVLMHSCNGLHNHYPRHENPFQLDPITLE